jgi:hypothetical protein
MKKGGNREREQWGRGIRETASERTAEDALYIQPSAMPAKEPASRNSLASVDVRPDIASFAESLAAERPAQLGDEAPLINTRVQERCQSAVSERASAA